MIQVGSETLGVEGPPDAMSGVEVINMERDQTTLCPAVASHITSFVTLRV